MADATAGAIRPWHRHRHARPAFGVRRLLAPYTADEPFPLARPAGELITAWLRSPPAGYRVEAASGPALPASHAMYRASWQPRLGHLLPPVSLLVVLRAEARHLSRLTVGYSYMPPGGRIGEAVDRLFLSAAFRRGLGSRIERLAGSLDAVDEAR